MINYNFILPLNNTGYGEAATRLLDAILYNHAFLPFRVEKIFPIGNVQIDFNEHHNSIKDLIDNRGVADKSFMFWHPGDSANKLVGTKENILYTTFETDKFLPQEIESMKKFDKVITATNWGRDILANHGFINDRVVPHFSKKEYKFNPYNLREMLKVKSPIYSTIGKYEIRKGYDVLFKWLHEKIDDELTLLISANNPFNPYALKQFLIKNDYNFSRSVFFEKSFINIWTRDNITIALVEYLQSQEDLYNLIGSADRFISLSHGEGLNIPLFDMINMQIPVIFSEIPAHRHMYHITRANYNELYDNSTNYVINFSNMVEAYDPPFFTGNRGKWYNIAEDGYNMLNTILKIDRKNISENRKEEVIPGSTQWQKELTNLAEILT